MGLQNPAKDLRFRSSDRRVYLASKTMAEAALINIRGRQAAVPCVACWEGSGPFEACAFVRGEARGVCGNCHFGYVGDRCSLQDLEPFPGLEVEELVDDTAVSRANSGTRPRAGEHVETVQRPDGPSSAGNFRPGTPITAAAPEVSLETASGDIPLLELDPLRSSPAFAEALPTRPKPPSPALPGAFPSSISPLTRPAEPVTNQPWIPNGYISASDTSSGNPLLARFLADPVPTAPAKRQEERQRRGLRERARTWRARRGSKGESVSSEDSSSCHIQ